MEPTHPPALPRQNTRNHAMHSEYKKVGVTTLLLGAAKTMRKALFLRFEKFGDC
jgi:hypothetical protein